VLLHNLFPLRLADMVVGEAGWCRGNMPRFIDIDNDRSHKSWDAAHPFGDLLGERCSCWCVPDLCDEQRLVEICGFVTSATNLDLDLPMRLSRPVQETMQMLAHRLPLVFH